MKKAKKQTGKLTAHQWRLFDYLHDLMIYEDNRTTTVEEIVAKFPLTEDYPDGYVLVKQKGNYSNCPKLYEDLKAITNSYEVDFVVTTNHNKIRFGTELDCLKRLRSLIERTRWEEKEIRTIKTKIKQNGQYKLLSNAGVPITDASPSTKAWHVVFSDENLALTIKQLEKEEKNNGQENGNNN